MKRGGAGMGAWLKLISMQRLTIARSYVLLLAAALLVTGCKPPPAKQTATAPSLAGIHLKLAVVNDPPLAESIRLLRGQWKSETGGELTVDTLSDEELSTAIGAGELSADVVIYTSRLLGAMAEKKLLLPLDRAALADEALDWADIFELIKTREVKWGAETYAVPFGAPVLLCFYRHDLLSALKQRPPRTWDEYQKLAALFAERGPTVATGAANSPDNTPGWRGTIEPLASGWAGLTFLARAAPYARHASHYSTLFNIDSMEPLIASPPFVRALEELVASAGVATKSASATASTTDGAAAMNPLDVSPREAWGALVAGRTGMALCWPSALPADAAPSNAAAEIACIELPGGADVYNQTSGKWEGRPQPASVPLLGIAGRVGSVTATTKEPKAALHLLAWLTSRRGLERLSATSVEIAPFRTTQIRASQPWVRDGLGTGEAADYVKTTAATLNSADCLVAPRIPGSERYLEALDAGVRKAVAGDAAPQAVLSEVADRWRAITAELGLEQQRAAYQASLGLNF